MPSPESLRLALIAPRFWPHWGDAERRMLGLAEGFLNCGHRVTVVSPRWQRAWPAEMCVGTVPLLRLRGSHKSGWSSLRWMYSLSRWLKEQANELDAVLISGLRQETYVAIRTLANSRLPIVALAHAGDLAWQQSATFGSRMARRCRQATAIIVPSQALARQLIAAEYADRKITVIPWSVPLPPPRSPVQREAARAALAGVNSDLITSDATPIGLAIGRLDDEHCFGDLVRAWRIVTAKRPEARLWIVGDGPNRERLYRQICDLDLRHRVLIPGNFDCLNELMAAADLFVQPAPCEAPPVVLVSALAAGLPAIAADSPAAREVIQGEQTGLLFSPGDPKALAMQIERLLTAPGEGVVLGSAARDLIRDCASSDAIVAQYANLLHGLQ
jgi:glycosyltransferase involved in cell wall biosynthesis